MSKREFFIKEGEMFIIDHGPCGNGGQHEAVIMHGPKSLAECTRIAAGDDFAVEFRRAGPEGLEDVHEHLQDHYLKTNDVFYNAKSDEIEGHLPDWIDASEIDSVYDMKPESAYHSRAHLANVL